MARPTKLTPSVRTKLTKALASGCYRETAARAAGIGVSTLYRWLEQGEADIEHDKATPYRELREAIEKAEADSEQALLAMVQAAAPKNWQAAAWMLERKNPDRWGRRDAMKVEHSGKIKHEAPVIPDSEERKREVARLLAAQGALATAAAHGSNGNGNGHG